MVKKIFANCYIYLILLLLYLPILVIMAYSFSSATIIGEEGAELSLIQWQSLFDFDSKISQEIWVAMGNTLIIALVSAIVSVVLGTLGAIGVFYSKNSNKTVIEAITQIPVSNPEIVIALSLTVLFVFMGQNMFGGKQIFSFWTLLVGHVVLSLPFVYLSVRPKLEQMDPNLYEAALDLGASPSQGLKQVIIPQIIPGIFSGFLLSMTLSLDDFIITAFTRGPGLLSGDKNIETLSTLVQSKLKKGTIPPEMRPLTVIIFVVVLLIVIGVTIAQNKKFRVKKTRKGRLYE